MLGCVVGTGNIWRFPRIMALHSEGGKYYNYYSILLINTNYH